MQLTNSMRVRTSCGWSVVQDTFGRGGQGPLETSMWRGSHHKEIGHNYQAFSKYSELAKPRAARAVVSVSRNGL